MGELERMELGKIMHDKRHFELNNGVESDVVLEKGEENGSRRNEQFLVH